MKQQIAHLMTRRITSDSFDLNFVRAACFAGAAFVLALSFWKLTRLELTEAQLFFGILLSTITPLLFIVLGLLFPGSIAAKKA